MTADGSSELEAGGHVRCELESVPAILHDFREFRERFLDDLHAIERRVIRTMVGTMLGGILTTGVIGLIVLAVSE